MVLVPSSWSNIYVKIIWNVSEFDLDEYLDSINFQVDQQSLQSQFADILLERLGVLQYMNPVQCTENTTKYQRNANGWNDGIDLLVYE